MVLPLHLRECARPGNVKVLVRGLNKTKTTLSYGPKCQSRACT
jgi:hypothetical protein